MREQLNPINWLVIRGTQNPVEILDKDTGKIVLRVYDWEGDGRIENKFDLRRKRHMNNLRKAGAIILAIKMLALERKEN